MKIKEFVLFYKGTEVEARVYCKAVIASLPHDSVQHRLSLSPTTPFLRALLTVYSSLYIFNYVQVLLTHGFKHVRSCMARKALRHVSLRSATSLGCGMREGMSDMTAPDL